VVVDVEGDEQNAERLKHILQRFGSAALLALKHGGPDNVVVELDAIKNVYLRNGEHLIPAKRWKEMLLAAGFSEVHTTETSRELGHHIFRCTK
jgi:hypothetical protein